MCNGNCDACKSVIRGRRWIEIPTLLTRLANAGICGLGGGQQIGAE
jgi:hypothetical protein